jgi:uncharacterized protein (DUF983 family)
VEHKVSKRQIIIRGLKNQCPNCGRSSLFEKGLKAYRTCPKCGITLDRGEGFYLGSMTLNYGFTIVLYLIPVLLLAVWGVISTKTAIIAGAVGGLLFPILFYRSSRSWWLMAYFYFLPKELPANRPDKVDDLDPDAV